MSFTTGNAERDSLIKRAIAECLSCNEPPSFGNVHEKLEHLAGFDLGEDELTGMIEAMKTAGGGELPEIEPHKSSVVRSGDVVDTALPPENGTKMGTAPARKITTREQSQRRVEAAHAALGEARVNVQVAQQHTADAKLKLAASILAWQIMADPESPELRQQREARAMIATSNQIRADRHNRVSVTAKQFVQKRMQNGRNRGAYSPQQAARVGYRVPGSQRNG
jgi:hypothetical protein